VGGEIFGTRPDRP